ncbi:hypothetical protein Acy02nite_40380 [Actinoplanes cyaneus]|uniref:Uncharacterized protein n=1 Tax=Actinoplanes cyaneus TaxID=52696 RepID=A0A919M501_9ACTN|nr:hypothetical protein [Actinoplanes cyaneus]MCW2139625.1 hypothetical protein [Actinoplanes cyaneus]GID66157.1 hypothetical protein Acy02nite_40380 [Actinoplanes cyaneus]
MRAVNYGDYHIDLVEGAGGLVRRRGEGAAAVPGTGRRSPATTVATPLGRQAQVTHAITALRHGRVVNFSGPCGIGKTRLLRHLAPAAGQALGRRATYLQVAAGEDADDVIQRLLQEIGALGPGERATPHRAGRALSEIRPVVALDLDADDEDTVAALVDRLSACAVVVGSEQPVRGLGLISDELPGLGGPDALILLSRDLGRELSISEQAASERLAAALGSRPLWLRQAAALVRRHESTLESLADATERDGKALSRRGLSNLDRTERQVLGLLAVFAGALVPAEWADVVGDVGKAREALVKLWDLGVVETENDRFGLPTCRADSGNAEHFFRTFDMTTVARDIADYLGSADPGADEALSLAKAVVTLIGEMAKRRQWKAVATLVEVVEPILTLAGRWATCRRILTIGIDAAHRLGDTAAEAAFRHEQGTLALCSGDADEARSQLSRAWEQRRRLGDERGADVTRHNLGLLAAPAVPAPAREPAVRRRVQPGRLARLGAVIGAIVAVVILVTGFMDAARSGDEPRGQSSQPVPVPTTPVPATPVRTPSAPTTPPSTSQPTTTGPTVPPVRGPLPTLTPSRAEFDRFRTTQRQELPTRPFEVRNSRDVPLVLGRPRVTDPAFVISEDFGACGGIVPAHATCPFTVLFRPQRIGEHAGRLILPLQGFADLSAQLSGTAVVTLIVEIVVDGEGASGRVEPGRGRDDCTSGECPYDFTAIPSPFDLTAIPCDSCLVNWLFCSTVSGAKKNICTVDLKRTLRVKAVFSRAKTSDPNPVGMGWPGHVLRLSEPDQQGPPPAAMPISVGITR